MLNRCLSWVGNEYTQLVMPDFQRRSQHIFFPTYSVDPRAIRNGVS
jgi:hypothetical protein